MTHVKRIDEMVKVELEVDDYCDYLQARYDDVVSQWGNDASEALWEQYLELIRECGVRGDTNASAVVDNYLINGDFRFRDDMVNKDGQPLTDEEWEDFCQDALLHDDKYVCMQC